MFSLKESAQTIVRQGEKIMKQNDRLFAKTQVIKELCEENSILYLENKTLEKEKEDLIYAKDMAERRNVELARIIKNIADEFLDKEKVKNEDIRSTYINEYVRRNSTIGKKKTDFKTYSHYNVLSDLYLVFCKAIKDEDREQLVLASIDENKINSVLNEVDTYMKELKTEENTENLKNELEEI